MRTRAAVLLSIFVGSMHYVPAVADTMEARQFDFDVFLDDRPIGYQRFALLPVGDGLQIETRGVRSQVPWNHGIRIFPPERGEVARPLRLGEREYKVEQYSMRGKDIDIVLSYAAGSGEWLALDSRLDGGRVLRYRRSDDPGSSSGATLPGV